MVLAVDGRNTRNVVARNRNSCRNIDVRSIHRLLTRRFRKESSWNCPLWRTDRSYAHPLHLPGLGRSYSCRTTVQWSQKWPSRPRITGRGRRSRRHPLISIHSELDAVNSILQGPNLRCYLLLNCALVEGCFLADFDTLELDRKLPNSAISCILEGGLSLLVDQQIFLNSVQRFAAKSLVNFNAIQSATEHVLLLLHRARIFLQLFMKPLLQSSILLPQKALQILLHLLQLCI
mmetsp:Transcript_37761/g.88665  ORF Transcript_37761/g.88665 Transcript_37761/m.88665 type:complete len:233 (-) Transcript_37761:886-1584(-)